MKHNFIALLFLHLLLSSFLNAFGQETETQVEIRCWEVNLSQFKKLDGFDWVKSNGILGLLGVFTKSQYEAIKKTSAVSERLFGDYRVHNKSAASFKSSRLNKSRIKITPEIGADGDTIDLLIEETPNSKPLFEKAPDISIRVTIWDQQVIAYNLQSDQKTIRFITAKIILPKNP